MEYGDAEKYRKQVEVIRRSYQDITGAGSQAGAGHGLATTPGCSA